MPNFSINAQDIAAANAALYLSQMLLDVAVEKGLITKEDVTQTLRDMAAHHAAPGAQNRKPVRDAIAELANMLALKYSGPAGKH